MGRITWKTISHCLSRFLYAFAFRYLVVVLPYLFLANFYLKDKSTLPLTHFMCCCEGKKSLYIRLGCRGDWPNIKPPGWDPSAGPNASTDTN